MSETFDIPVLVIFRMTNEGNEEANTGDKRPNRRHDEASGDRGRRLVSGGHSSTAAVHSRMHDRRYYDLNNGLLLSSHSLW